MRLAIVSSHPIQYNAPWFRLLAAGGKITPCVFYTWGQSQQGSQYDPDFGKVIAWDIPLLEGYEHKFIPNQSAQPGTHHFKGIVNASLIKEIEEWRPDAILIFGWSFDSHLKCLRHFHKKIPVLFRGDSTLLDEQPGLKRTLRRLFLKWVYRHIDYALYVGERNKEYFKKHGLRDDQLVFAPHAIDNDRFSTPETQYAAEAKDWRIQLNIAQENLVILFAGKLEPKKDPAFLLRLAKEIPSPRLKFVIVGNGVLESQLKQDAAQDPRIIFLDFQNQSKMPGIYRIGDVFILPSNGPGETWGLAVNEAMASGRAVMVSDRAGGAVDLVKENANGIIFSKNDSAGCIRFLTSLLDNPGQLGDMQTQSRRIISRFSFQNIIASLENLLSNKN